MTGIGADVMVEALFASSLQPSQAPTAHQVRAAVADTVARIGAVRCAAIVAQEFGDHPETAVRRMAWARQAAARVNPPAYRPPALHAA
jgi:hypothetical protein